MGRESILLEIQAELRRLYGPRLEGVVVFGSAARGDDRDDSDIDILVLLSPPLAYGQELARLAPALFPISLKWGREISPKPALSSDFEDAKYPLYRNAKRDGVLL